MDVERRSNEPIRPNEPVSAPDGGQVDVCLGQADVQVGGRPCTVDDPHHLFGVEELDAIIASKVALLIVPPIGVAKRMAFLGIDDEWTLFLDEFAIRHDVDALVAHQPEPRLFVLAGSQPIMRIAEPVVGGGIDDTAVDDFCGPPEWER